jgi:hypothetical protein
VTDEQLDREAERLFAAARKEQPAGALRERVLRGVARGERARARARRWATFGWAAVAAGVGGLVWLGASAMDRAPDVGAEPERAGALNPVPEMPSARQAPKSTLGVATPAATPSVAPAPPSASVRRAPAAPAASDARPRAASASAPRRASSAEPSASALPPPPPDLSKAMEERK